MFGAGVPSREAVDGMEFTLAALKESLRKYSVVPVVTRNLVQVGREAAVLGARRALRGGTNLGRPPVATSPAWRLPLPRAHPAALGRCKPQEDELLGYKLPRGAWLIVHLQGIHHQYQEPLAWRPERYLPGGEYDQFDESIRPYMVSCLCGLGGSAALCVREAGSHSGWPTPRQHARSADAPQFLPFIQGPRNCLGQYFALLENRVLLSVLSQVGSRALRPRPSPMLRSCPPPRPCHSPCRRSASRSRRPTRSRVASRTPRSSPWRRCTA